MPKLILHDTRFVEWACCTFGIAGAAEAAETITVDGQEHTIPGECYMTWEEMDAASAARRCRICGCTDERGCAAGCFWVEDDLCSMCQLIAANPHEEL